jgi:hypothetical protein
VEVFTFVYPINILRPDIRFVSLIRDNPTWPKSWPQLTITAGTKKDFQIILRTLTPEIKRLAFHHLTSLEMKSCTISWRQYFTVLSDLNCLISFADMDTGFKFDKLWKFCCKTTNKIERNIVEKFGETEFKLRKLKIHRPFARFKTLLLLRLLRALRLENLEVFEFKIQNTKFPITVAVGDHFDYATMLGLFLVTHSDTLKELSLEWGGEHCFLYMEDLYRTLRVVTFLRSPLTITKLSLHFDYLFLANPTFQDVLVPFVQGLTHLKYFSLKRIILQPEWMGLLMLTQPLNFFELETEISLGMLLSDHPNIEFAQQNIRMILDNATIQGRATSFRVAISSEETNELKDILPVNEITIYERMKELFVNRMDYPNKRRAQTQPMGLVNFNIDLMCSSFENLTTLVVTDGSAFPYYGRFRIKKQYDKMSVAELRDREVQLILRYLKKLQKIRLRVRLASLTDSGMTGLAEASCLRMRQSGDFRGTDEEVTENNGLSFSNLKGGSIG